MPIDTPPVKVESAAPGGAVTTLGTVFSVLFGVPAFFIGVFGVVNIVSGESYLGGFASATWGFAATLGAYELNRSRFDWDRGRKRCNLNLGAGMLAVCVAIIGSGATENVLFIFALFPAMAAINHAHHRFNRIRVSIFYVVPLVVSLAAAIWLYRNEETARQLAAWVEAWP